jgi:hypothetical protein
MTKGKSKIVYIPNLISRRQCESAFSGQDGDKSIPDLQPWEDNSSASIPICQETAVSAHPEITKGKWILNESKDLESIELEQQTASEFNIERRSVFSGDGSINCRLPRAEAEPAIMADKNGREYEKQSEMATHVSGSQSKNTKLIIKTRNEISKKFPSKDKDFESKPPIRFAVPNPRYRQKWLFEPINHGEAIDRERQDMATALKHIRRVFTTQPEKSGMTENKKKRPVTVLVKQPAFSTVRLDQLLPEKLVPASPRQVDLN